MFDSGVSPEKLIAELKDEVDVAYEIGIERYVDWLNSVEQLLYSEIIQEQREVIILCPTDNKIHYGNIYPQGTAVSKVYADVRFGDIHAIYLGDTQLIKTTLASGAIFPNCYFDDGDGYLCISTMSPERLYARIILYARPDLHDADIVAMPNLASAHNVMVPIEFIDLVKAKLRGEAYKLANEDVLAAKWLNDYNILLENFKAWIAAKKPNFGL